MYKKPSRRLPKHRDRRRAHLASCAAVLLGKLNFLGKTNFRSFCRDIQQPITKVLLFPASSFRLEQRRQAPAVRDGQVSTSSHSGRQ
jgi:hypothetical protein